MTRQPVTDQWIEIKVSNLLRAGVLIAGAVVLFGGIGYLVRHGSEPIAYNTFHSQPAIDRRPGEILRWAAKFRMRSIIQAGMLLLIATPIARVALALAGFVLERDRAYVIITAIVLAVLLYSLISGIVAA